MADNWISSIIVGAVSRPVANAVASAGGFAGSAVGGVGNAINGVGKGIENSIRYYGDGVKDYGNAIQDWTKASGPRQATAGNPLGLGGSQVAGKLAFSGSGKPRSQEKKPPIQAPRTDPRASAQKALPAPQKAAAPSKAPAAKSAATVSKPRTTVSTTAPKPKTSTSAASSTGSGAAKKKISAQSRPERTKPPVRSSAPKSSYGSGSKAAANPLGI